MDSSRFDKLTKALATSTTRRRAFKIIAATTFGSILGVGGLGAAGTAEAAQDTCQASIHGICSAGASCPPDLRCCATKEEKLGVCSAWCCPGSQHCGKTPGSCV